MAKGNKGTFQQFLFSTERAEHYLVCETEVAFFVRSIFSLHLDKRHQTLQCMAQKAFVVVVVVVVKIWA